MIFKSDFWLADSTATSQSEATIENHCKQTPIFITVTSLWGRWRFKSPASRLFTQPLILWRSKKTSKLTGLCVGNSPVTDEFPAQMASNAENVSIWWRYHVNMFVFSNPGRNNFYNYDWYQLHIQAFTYGILPAIYSNAFSWMKIVRFILIPS